MAYYAILDVNNRCSGVGHTTGELTVSPRILPLETEDQTLIGRIWDGSIWSDPAPVPPSGRMATDEFIDRFTLLEQVALQEAAATDSKVATLLNFLKIRNTVNLNADVAISIRDYLITQAPIGVLTEARITAIFTP